jgi:hypothetical protein
MPVLQNRSPVYRHWEIARLIRAGLDTCISPRLLINTESLFFATRQCTSTRNYRASHRRSRRTLPMTQPRIFFHSTKSTFQGLTISCKRGTETQACAAVYI